MSPNLDARPDSLRSMLSLSCLACRSCRYFVSASARCSFPDHRTFVCIEPPGHASVLGDSGGVGRLARLAVRCWSALYIPMSHVFLLLTIRPSRGARPSKLRLCIVRLLVAST